VSHKCLPAEHGAQDHHLPGKGEDRAMSEVGTPQHAVDQGIAEGKQRIDCADMQAVQKLLGEIEHAACPPDRRPMVTLSI
jgi:hypothetical protein